MTYLTQRTLVGWAAADGTLLYFPTIEGSVDLNPVEFTVADNGEYIGANSPAPAKYTGRKATAKFSTWLYGASSGTEIPVSPLLGACGMAISPATIVTSQDFTTSSADLHIDADLDAVDIGIWIDGVIWYMDECVGNAELVLEAGKLPRINWEFIGQASANSGAILAAPSMTTTNISNPVPVAAGSASVNPGGEGAVTAISMSKLVINLNNKLAERPDVSGTYGYGAPLVTGNRPTLTAELDYLVPTGAGIIIDFEARLAAASYLTWAYTHGTGLGANQGFVLGFKGDPISVSRMDTDGVLRVEVGCQLSIGGSFSLDYTAS